MFLFCRCLGTGVSGVCVLFFSKQRTEYRWGLEVERWCFRSGLGGGTPLGGSVGEAGRRKGEIPERRRVVEVKSVFGSDRNYIRTAIFNGKKTLTQRDSKRTKRQEEYENQV